jgi:Ser-tRNA(Ala) deacylase AlaX
LATVLKEGLVLGTAPCCTPAGGGRRGATPAGTAVRTENDWDRRHLIMRTHTALHALSGIVWRHCGAKVTGDMDPPATRMDVELDGITAEFGREVEG